MHEFSAPELEEVQLQFLSLNSQIVYNNSVIIIKGLITRVPVFMSPRIPHCDAVARATGHQTLNLLCVVSWYVFPVL